MRAIADESHRQFTVGLMAGALPDANTIMTIINPPEDDKSTHLALLAIQRLLRILSHSRLREAYQRMSSMRQENHF